MPFIVSLFLSICVLGMLSCKTQQDAPPKNDETAIEKNARVNHGVRNTPPERMLRTQTTPHYRVSYSPDTDPIPLNVHFRLRVNLQELVTTRAPESPVEMTADADMPEHNHGMQITPEVSYLGQGQYEIKGLLFHMAGYWELKLELLNDDGQKETAIFGVEVQERATQKTP